MDDVTIKQLSALLGAMPKRIPYFDGQQIIECTACRKYFVNGKAWKSHRRTGTCDTTRLKRNDLGIHQLPIRKRVKVQL